MAFRLLHSECHSPVRYRKWCPACNLPLEPGEIARGYEYEKGRFVILTDEEVEAVPGPDAHKVEILDFVKLEDVDPVFFEKSYFLEPRDGAEKAYKLLLESMKQQGKVAVARVALRARETLAVVRTYKDSFIMLETMYWADEVRAGQELRVPEDAELDEREMKLAITLIETLSSEFEPEKYKSRQRQALEEIIQRKIQGKQIVAEPEKAPEVIDLMEALRRSVERAKTGNVAAGAGVTEAGGDAGSSPGSGLGGTVEEMGSGPAGR